jgi:hypothetical protein
MRKISALLLFMLFSPVLSSGEEIPSLKKFKDGGSLKMPNGPEIRFYISKKIPPEEILKRSFYVENIVGSHKINDHTYEVFYIPDKITSHTKLKSFKLLRLETDIWVVSEKTAGDILLLEIKE